MKPGTGVSPSTARSLTLASLAPIPGVRAIETVLGRHPRRVKKLLVAGLKKGARAALVEQAEALGVAVEGANQGRLDRLTDGVRHQGVVALAEPAGYVAWNDLLEKAGVLVAFDGVTDPRNLGAILRSAEALGAAGALVTRSRCAHLGPAVTRTSAGASELLPVAMESNLARALRAAQSAGFQVVGAAVEGQPAGDVDWSPPTVLVIGAEGSGLRRLTRDVCDTLASIRLRGTVESLNASAAATVLLYEALRVRAAITSVAPRVPMRHDGKKRD